MYKDKYSNYLKTRIDTVLILRQEENQKATYQIKKVDRVSTVQNAIIVICKHRFITLQKTAIAF